MVNNVRTIIENNASVLEMESKSLSIKETAFNVQTNARRLEQEARKRQMRLYAVIAIVGLCILLYILVPIITHFQKKKKTQVSDSNEVLQTPVADNNNRLLKFLGD